MTSARLAIVVVVSHIQKHKRFTMTGFSYYSEMLGVVALLLSLSSIRGDGARALHDREQHDSSRLLATTTTTIFPIKVRPIKGAVSGQDISVLSKPQQTGSQNTWSTYVEISAGAAAVFKTQFDFVYNPTLLQGKVLQGLTLHINSEGLPYSQQRRTWQLKRGNGAWVSIANNLKAPDWTWHAQSITVTNNPADYYNNSSGTITVQLLSNNKADVMDLDYLALDVVTSSTTAGGPTSSPVAAPPTATTKTHWQPKASDKLTYQYQLQGTIDTTKGTNIYDIDLFGAVSDGKIIDQLHAKGIKVVCYFSAGTYESWNTDWHDYFSFIPAGVYYNGTNPPIAHAMADWAGERWLDITRLDLLEPIMTSRIVLAAKSGCDAVDPDNMDVYSNAKEAGLVGVVTAAHQLAYNRKIAEIAHAHGLAVGLKNDLEQLGDLVDYYDFAVNEECFTYNECSLYSTFTNVDKPVFGVQYAGDPAVFCPKANRMNLSFSLKHLDLGAYRVGCENY
jgi:hypothetical protein